jgi:hypothetical protein
MKLFQLGTGCQIGQHYPGTISDRVITVLRGCPDQPESFDEVVDGR